MEIIFQTIIMIFFAENKITKPIHINNQINHKYNTTIDRYHKKSLTQFF